MHHICKNGRKGSGKGSTLQGLAKNGITAYNLALADTFHAPKVFAIGVGNYHGAIGKIITVQAQDDFKMVAVLVSIHNDAGALIEQGNAVMSENELDWSYTATGVNTTLKGSKITATATDIPGNMGSLDMVLP